MTQGAPQKKERLATQVVNLAGMVAYQPDSVVSRTIVDSRAGTVTLFAFDRGQGLSEHTAPFDALVYIIDGDAGVTISGEHFHLKAGEAIVMPANHPHALEAASRFKMMLVMIKS